MEVLHFLSVVRHMGINKGRLQTAIQDHLKSHYLCGDKDNAYKDESMSREEQIMTFKEDEKRECVTTFF